MSAILSLIPVLLLLLQPVDPCKPVFVAGWYQVKASNQREVWPPGMEIRLVPVPGDTSGRSMVLHNFINKNLEVKGTLNGCSLVFPPQQLEVQQSGAASYQITLKADGTVTDGLIMLNYTISYPQNPGVTGIISAEKVKLKDLLQSY